MKLMFIIINQDNENDVTTSLIKGGFQITKLATSGGFLKKGNTTLMSCVEDEKVKQAIDIIKSECGEHQSVDIDIPITLPSASMSLQTVPTKIEIGGATIIVTDVFLFEKF